MENEKKTHKKVGSLHSVDADEFGEIRNEQLTFWRMTSF